jgi:hypothetical protein
MTEGDRILRELIAVTKQAYQFHPCSYSYSCLQSAFDAAERFETKPDWIPYICSWQNQSELLITRNRRTVKPLQRTA